MRLNNSVVKVIVLFLMALSVFIFLYLYEDTNSKVEEVKAPNDSIENWSLDKSFLNGAKLLENKNIYLNENPSKITKIYITVFPTKDDEGNLLNLSAFDLHKSREKEYDPVLNANIQFENEKGELGNISNLDIVNASISVRGNSSRGAAYKSYKVKLKDGAETFFGQSVLNLNKHVYDISKVSNKFAMDIMQPIENMASFRTNFMQVYIRDASLPTEKQIFKYTGLYTHVEQPNKSYLKARGLDENGSMYKASNFEFRITPEIKNVNDPQYDEEAFGTILDIREGNDHSKLIKMLNDANDMNQDFNKVFSKYFNEDNYLTWIATNILLGNEDTIAHNFILYNPKNSLTWYMLPWDFDGTFKFGKYKSMYSAPESLTGIQRYTGVLLHRRFFKQNGSVEKLTSKMEELLRSSFSDKRVSSLIESYKPVINQTITLDPDILISDMAPNEFNDYLNQLDEQIKLNYKRYLKAIEYPTPMFVSEPTINKDGTIDFSWESSFDFQGDLITYGIKLAKDYNMQDIVFEASNLTENRYKYKALPPGTYYMAVTAKDRKGNEQLSLDYFSDETKDVYKFGVRKIEIK